MTLLPPYPAVFVLPLYLILVRPALVVSFPSIPFYASFSLADFGSTVTRARHCVKSVQHLRRRVCCLLRVRYVADDSIEQIMIGEKKARPKA